MSYEVRVNGEDMPWTVGDHPALDFCNTYAGWHRTLLPGNDWLPTYRALAVWTGYVNLIDEAAVNRLLEQAKWDPGQAGRLIEDALALRSHLYRCLTDTDDQVAFGAVARHAESAARAMTYTWNNAGRGRWQPNPDSHLHLPTHAIAWSAAELLADPRRFIVRACPNPRCGWLFLDETGTRRRCNLATCGQHADSSAQ
ncbi:CGNR zinc finger domain-containing protein [Actinoplanes sp. G11-F43]|uniref:CGNR zinc finger domain-containing protein n=1 Tax=Actinoplanes sp. G11-F43 TaxID=3424130 RepID=UPI003D34F4DB